MGSIIAILKLIPQIIEGIGVLIGIGAKIYHAYLEWKNRHPDVKKPMKTFVENKMVNPVTTPALEAPSTMVPLKQLPNQRRVAATENGQPVTLSPDTYEDAVKRMQEIAKDGDSDPNN